MPDKRADQLTVKTTLATTDIMIVADPSTGAMTKITVVNLIDNLADLLTGDEYAAIRGIVMT